LSTKGVLSAAESSAFERWQFSSSVPAVPVADEPSPRIADASELEGIRETARKSGYEAGLEQGRDDGAQQLRQEVAAVKALLTALARPLADIDQTVEMQLVELASEVGIHLFRRELKSSPEQIVELVREALNALPFGTTGVVVRLSRADARLLSANGCVAEQGWEIVEDDTVEAGGCRLQTSASELDATVQSRADGVRELLGGRDG
jgi:flagellar assembly protein FliH